MRRIRRSMPVLAVLLCMAVSALGVAGCAPGRLAESARVLDDIEAGVLPSRLKATTPPPSCATVGYRRAGPMRLADLYMPGEPAAAGLVLVPGAHAGGKDEPRLVAFAESLARARFAVLVPDLPGLRGLRVRAGEADLIGDAVLALSRHRAASGDATLGIAAISFAAGPAVLALLDPAVGEKTHFMLSIGGYYDVEAVIRFFTTGYYRDGRDGRLRRREANPYGKWLFAGSNASFLDDAGDRARLEAMARRRLRDTASDLSDLVAGLGPQGRAVYDLLVNRDPARVPRLLDALPQRVRTEIAALDLKRRHFGGLATRFILVHGRDDPVIPESESVALAGVLRNADLFLLGSLDHVDPKPAGLGDRLEMLWAMAALLAERDRVRPPPAAVAGNPFTVLAAPCERNEGTAASPIPWSPILR